MIFFFFFTERWELQIRSMNSRKIRVNPRDEMNFIQNDSRRIPEIISREKPSGVSYDSPDSWLPSKRVRSQIFDDRAITRLYYITCQFRKNFCLKDRATTDPPVRKLDSLPAKTREIGETLVKNRLPAIRFHPLFLGGRTLGEARVYISFTGSVSTAFLPSSATPPPSDGGGVYWKSWSPDQFPRDSSPCINGIATIPLGGSGLDAFVHSDTGKCTNDRRLWITISRLPNSMAVTWACTRMRTYGREREHVPNTWALLVAHLSYGFRGWGWGRGYGLRFYILTRVRLTWFPLHEGDRFDLVCLLNTVGLYQVLAKSYGGISRIICVLKKFDRSGGRVNFRNISFVVNFESEVKGIRFGGRNFQRCSIPILLFLFQVRFEFDCHSTTLEYIYIYIGKRVTFPLNLCIYSETRHVI